jgi:hypothetical protein
VDNRRAIVFDLAASDGEDGMKAVLNPCDVREFYLYTASAGVFSFVEGPLPIDSFNTYIGIGVDQCVVMELEESETYTEGGCWFKAAPGGGGVIEILPPIIGYGKYWGDWIGAMQSYSQQELVLLLGGWEHKPCNSGNG